MLTNKSHKCILLVKPTTGNINHYYGIKSHTKQHFFNMLYRESTLCMWLCK